jgi:hypothetical protein
MRCICVTSAAWSSRALPACKNCKSNTRSGYGELNWTTAPKRVPPPRPIVNMHLVLHLQAEEAQCSAGRVLWQQDRGVLV